jgi:WD40 repeat protein
MNTLGCAHALPALTGQRRYLALDISADGRWVAAASTAGYVDLWSNPRWHGAAHHAAVKPLHSFIAGKAALRAVAFAPDGQRLAALDDAGRLSLWSTAELPCVPPAIPSVGEQADCSPPGDGGHEAVDKSRELLYPPARRLDQEPCWQLPTNPSGHADPPLRPFASYVVHAGAGRALAWLRGGHALVSVGDDTQLVITDVHDGRQQQLAAPLLAAGGRTLALCCDDELVFSAGTDHRIHRWSLATTARWLDATPLHQGWWHRLRHRIVALAASPDGRWIAAAASRDPAIHVLRAPEGKRLLTCKVTPTIATVLCFGSSPSLLAAGDRQGALVVVDLAKRQSIASGRAQRRAITSICWRDETIIAADGSATLIALAMTPSVAPGQARDAVEEGAKPLPRPPSCRRQQS